MAVSPVMATMAIPVAAVMPTVTVPVTAMVSTVTIIMSAMMATMVVHVPAMVAQRQAGVAVDRTMIAVMPDTDPPGVNRGSTGSVTRDVNGRVTDPDRSGLRLIRKGKTSGDQGNCNGE